MKIRTRIGNCKVYFAYESYDGWEKFGNYPGGECYLTGYAYSPYYNCTERIDEKFINKRPTISEVKEFIKHCFKVMED